MSKVVDSRVVEMSFDNSKFEKGVKQSMTSLNALDKKISTTAATNGLKSIGDSVNNIDLSGLMSSIDSISKRFSTAGIAAMTVIQEVTTALMHKGKQAFDFVGDLIVQGGIRRSANIEKAKFQMEGLGIAYADLEDAIDYAVTNTAYGLDQAAVAASQLVASGLDYKEVIGVHKTDGKELTKMHMALRAVSGVAAQSQTEYEQVARYFQDVANAGKVTGATLTYMTQVLNLPVKQDLAEGLKAIADGSYEASEDVQANVKKLGNLEKLTLEDISEFVKQGSIDAETFMTIMFNKYADHAVAANNTLEGVKSNIRAAFAKIGQDFIQPIIANEGPLVKFLDEVMTEVNQIRMGIQPFSRELANLVNRHIISLTGILKHLNLPARITLAKSLIYDLSDVLTRVKLSLHYISKIVKDSFAGVFVKSLADSYKHAKSLNTVIHQFLTTISSGLSKFNIYKYPEEVEKIKRALQGVFSVVDILVKTFKSLLSIVTKVFDHFSKGGKIKSLAESFLDGAASLGDLITNFDKFLTESKFFDKSVDKISGAIITLIEIIEKAKNKIVEFSTKVKETFENNGVISGIIGFGVKISEAFKQIVVPEGLISNIQTKIGELFDKIKELFSKFSFGDIADEITKDAENVLSVIGNAILKLVEFIVDLINGSLELVSKIDYEKALAGGGLIMVVNQFLKLMKKASGTKSTISNLLNFFIEGATTIPKTVNEMTKGISALKSSLFKLQDTLKATMIKEIATAILMIAASMFILSTIDSDKLMEVSMVMVTFAAALYKAFNILKSTDADSGMFGDNGPKSMNAMATTLIKMAAAMLILAMAVKMLAKLNPVNMGMSILALMSMLVVMVKVLDMASKVSAKMSEKQMVAFAGSMILLAMAIKVLAKAVKILAKLDPGKMWSSLAAVMVMFGAMTAALIYMSKYVSSVEAGEIQAFAVSILIISAAMRSLALSIAVLSLLDYGKMWSAVGAILTLVIVIGAAMTAVSKIANPAGMIVFAASMLVLGVAMIAFSVGITILTGALILMSKVDWESIGKFAVVLGALTVAMIFMTAGIVGAAAMMVMAKALKILVPALVALSLIDPVRLSEGLKTLGGALFKLALMAVGLSVASPFILAASVALLALGVAVAVVAAGCLIAATALGLIVTAMTALAALDMTVFTMQLMMVLKTIPIIARAIGQAIVEIVRVFVESKEDIINLLATLMEAVLGAVNRLWPQIVTTLKIFFTGLFDLLRTLIPDLASLLADISLAILQELEARIPEFAQAAADIIAAFLQALSDGNVAIIDAAFQAIISFINGLTEAINTRTPELVEAVKALGKALLDAFILILTGGNEDIKVKGGEILTNLKKGFEEKVSQVLDFFRDLIRDIGERIKQGRDDLKRSGGYIIDGLKEGIDNAKQRVLDTISNLGNAIKEAFNFSVNINSPSKDFAESGMYIVLGLVKGIKDYASKAVNEAGQLGEDVLAETNDVLSGLSEVFTDMDDFNPVITPTLDLSRLNSEASQISSMLGRHSVKVSGDVQNDGTSSGGATYNFTQNNYSPEALSRYEIYRQTKNQLSMMKGVVKNA